VLTVTDQGPGIEPALHTRVFDRFYRGSAQAPGGSGLGLSIVKSAVEKHRGTVSLAHGSAGRGLQVVVALPAHAGNSTTAGLPRATEDSPG
jgi:signal transduction histidine kinase